MMTLNNINDVIDESLNRICPLRPSSSGAKSSQVYWQTESCSCVRKWTVGVNCLAVGNSYSHPSGLNDNSGRSGWLILEYQSLPLAFCWKLVWKVYGNDCFRSRISRIERRKYIEKKDLLPIMWPCETMSQIFLICGFHVWLIIDKKNLQLKK